MQRLFCALFINTLIVVNNVKNVRTSCELDNKEVVCKSIKHFTNISLSEIEHVESITYIKVKNNSELVLHPNAFKSTVNLRYLIIEFNNINKIFPNTFEDLPLIFLHLDNNGIEVVSPGAFLNLSKLETLSLAGNNLDGIVNGIFNNISTSELILSRNKISFIEDMALANILKLWALNLDHNQLDTIFVHTILTYPELLERLCLSNNKLTAVTNYMLQKLTNLKLLDLSFNSIFFIEPNSFGQTPKLRRLELSQNHLKKIDGTIFSKVGLNYYLEQVNLDHNKLMFLSSSFFSHLDNLKRITLVGNPWLCPCFDAILRILEVNNISQKCGEGYSSGRRPLCVNEKGGYNSTCKYRYNEELREKYETYEETYPLPPKNALQLTLYDEGCLIC